MLKIHFVNVGHGDCIIIEFAGRLTMIDINRTKEMDDESYEEIISEYLEENLLQKALYEANLTSKKDIFSKAYTIELQDPISYLNGHSIFRFISTHPHNDHISGFNELIENKLITNLWVYKNNYEPKEENDDWATYKQYRDCDDNKLNEVTLIRALEGDIRQFWDEDQIFILAPNQDIIDEANTANNANMMSYVLLIQYGECKILLGGDAEEKTWEHIMDNYEDEIKDISILKASHHGRDSGYHQPAVKQMNPEYTIVSVGKKTSTDASNKYRQYCDNVFSTRWCGNIVFNCYSNGKIEVEKQYDR